MENMISYFWILSSIIILGIFIYKREILIQKTTFIYILILTFAMFVLSFIPFLQIKTDGGIESWKLPLLSLLLFRGLRRIFLRIFGHEPRDTFWIFKKGFWEDGLFNFLFIVFQFGLIFGINKI